jgi:hypothetical protein
MTTMARNIPAETTRKRVTALKVTYFKTLAIVLEAGFSGVGSTVVSIVSYIFLNIKPAFCISYDENGPH